MENSNNIDNQDNNEAVTNKPEEILQDVASKLAAYEQYKRENGSYSIGGGSFGFRTNNPLIARFFVYPVLVFIFLLGMGMLFFSDMPEKIAGGVIMLISGFMFLSFKKRVRNAKARLKNYEI